MKPSHQMMKELMDEALPGWRERTDDLVSLQQRVVRLETALRGFIGFVDGGYAASSVHEQTLRELAKSGREALGCE